MISPILLRGLGALAITAIAGGEASAQQTAPTPNSPPAVTIDLPTVLDRAGANSIDLALAREAVAQAKASDLQATMKLFPYLTLGGQYYDHGGGVANVNGVVIDADKSLSTLSATITAQIDLGNAIGGKMIAEERQVGAKARLDAQHGTTIRNAALAYFELAGSGAEVGVLRDAVRTSEDYQAQLGRAVDLGLAARGEAIRAEVEVQTNKIALRQAEERAARASLQRFPNSCARQPAWRSCPVTMRRSRSGSSPKISRSTT
ncbi:MAG: TolC family protein [Hyphomonadaceae bacterium]|nr:TolC family protein [Hyphomonadaceae bacterium]